ncbi:ABC transporter substrate-binding protein [Nocardiopsis xinjiangensis]|uniref:ABC transporter substrate-binding protein n=1 Tax=Nocardiopsis xinjiangensis TaxID=124285 RepID=UPI00047634AD|nr:extracellular solute-binding protein [Nocardiopsis xinjiangensis]
MPPRFRARPLLRVAAAGSALALLATACGDGDDGTVELRFSWWGSDSRHEALQEVIADFEAENPGISVSGDYTDWSNYWDRLATNTAANDSPDIIMQDDAYLSEYADRGALYDLTELETLDLSEMDPLMAESGVTEDGTTGAVGGVNAMTIAADPQAFEEAGVDMPDDENWTWGEYAEISEEITDATDGEIIGTQGPGNENVFQIYARQHGENLFDENGEIAYSDETLTSWYEFNERLIEEGIQPSASRSVELAAAGPEQSLVGMNEGAMAFFWSNQLVALESASGRDLELLRMPGEAEFERTGLFYKPSIYYSVAAGSDHPEEAGQFVDYLLNDPASARVVQGELGIPANLEVRDAIVDDLGQADTKATEFIDEIEDSIVDGNPPQPIGAGEVVDINLRVMEDLGFGNATPEQASEQFTSAVQEATEPSGT